MTQIVLDIDREMNREEIIRVQEILVALVSSGGLTGMKSGKTIINFDNNGVFQGIQFDYWPWRRRAKS